MATPRTHTARKWEPGQGTTADTLIQARHRRSRKPTRYSLPAPAPAGCGGRCLVHQMKVNKMCWQNPSLTERQGKAVSSLWMCTTTHSTHPGPLPLLCLALRYPPLTVTDMELQQHPPDVAIRLHSSMSLYRSSFPLVPGPGPSWQMYRHTPTYFNCQSTAARPPSHNRSR